MNYTLQYDPGAAKDLKKILDQLFDLPQRFRNELWFLLQEIDEFPERWPLKPIELRRAQLSLTKKLQYYVFYRLLESEKQIQIIQIIQIIDQRSNPLKWREQ